MADPVNFSLSVTLSVIKHMEAEVKRLDKKITKLMKGIPNTLISIKGVGPVYAAGLIAEIGDIFIIHFGTDEKEKGKPVP